MQDPQQIAHKAYLNSVEQAARPDRRRPYREDGATGRHLKIRTLALCAAFLAVLAVQPWAI